MYIKGCKVGTLITRVGGRGIGPRVWGTTVKWFKYIGVGGKSQKAWSHVWKFRLESGEKNM